MTDVHSKLQLRRAQVVAHRLRVNNLTSRLPMKSYEAAAWVGLQDSGPRDALVGLHARVESCEPGAWEDPSLIQTYSPRQAVYVLPRADFGLFTVGRLPVDPEARRVVEKKAELVCRELAGREIRFNLPSDLRAAAATGRIALRWTTSALYVREVPRPAVDFDEVRIELCRRHVHAFGPTTPETYAWWAGLMPDDAIQTWRLLEKELVPVDVDGVQGFVLARDEQGVRTAAPVRGARLLPPADVRLFGQHSTRVFIGPGLHRVSPLHDSFHPHGVLVDGEIVGVWGRRRGHVDIRVGGRLDEATKQAIEAEALSLPIPGARMRVEISSG